VNNLERATAFAEDAIDHIRDARVFPADAGDSIDYAIDALRDAVSVLSNAGDE
jgi:hypothetical protein